MPVCLVTLHGKTITPRRLEQAVKLYFDFVLQKRNTEAIVVLCVVPKNHSVMLSRIVLDCVCNILAKTKQRHKCSFEQREV